MSFLLLSQVLFLEGVLGALSCRCLWMPLHLRASPPDLSTAVANTQYTSVKVHTNSRKKTCPERREERGRGERGERGERREQAPLTESRRVWG
jgi:hypothetical protein